MDAFASDLNLSFYQRSKDAKEAALSFVVPTEGVLGEWQLSQRMIVSLEANRRSIADLAYDFNARSCFSNAEALSCEYLLIAKRMELSEALTELELAAVNI